MSGELIDLFPLCKGLIHFVLDIVRQIFYGIGGGLQGLLPPAGDSLRGVGDFFVSDWLVVLLAWLIAINVMILWGTALNLLTMMWIERKFYSRLQDRVGIKVGLTSMDFLARIPVLGGLFRNFVKKPSHLGTGFLQNVADGVKLVQKENLTPAKADSFTFHAAPVMIASSTLLIFAALPFSDGFVVMNTPRADGSPSSPFGILFILAAFGIAPVAILIAGWSSNNKYTLLGGMRSAAMLMSYEIPMILCLIAVVVLTGSLDPFEIVRQQTVSLSQTMPVLGFLPGTANAPFYIPSWNIIPQFLAFVIFCIAVLAEQERIPFDLPEAEAELVEGWLTEYSGMRFGLVFGFKWLRALACSALLAILFLGGWTGPHITLSISGFALPLPFAELWFLAKIYLVFMVYVWISWSFPRIRIDQILNIGWKVLIPPSLLAIFLSIVLRATWVYQ